MKRLIAKCIGMSIACVTTLSLPAIAQSYSFTTTYDAPGDYVYMPTYSGTSGSFDISAQLGSGLVTSATITAHFADDPDSRVWNGNSLYNWQYDYMTTTACGAFVFGTCYDVHYVYSSYTYLIDPFEQAYIATSGLAAYGNSPHQSYQFYNYTEYSWNGNHETINNYYTIVDGNWGYFDITFNLNATGLGLLNSPAHTLGFSVGSNFGDLVFYGADLYVTAMTQAVAAPVPEPETYAMMLAGLALLGGAAKRKKTATR